MISPTRAAGTLLGLGVSALTTGLRLVGKVAHLGGHGSDDASVPKPAEPKRSEPRTSPAQSPASSAIDGGDVAARAREAAQAELARPVEVIVEVDALDLVEAVVSEPVEDQLVYSTVSSEESGSTSSSSESSGAASRQ